MMPVAPEAPISVYVPCRNGASTLRACLEALLSQTYPVAEIIVVDDGSSDTTASIVVAVGGSVRAVSHPVHLGLPQARNTALAQVRHELVASVDADVVPEPQWLECMVRAMSTRATALVAGRLVASDRSRIADRWRMAHLMQDAGDLPQSNPRHLSGSNTLVRRGAIQAIGGYPDDEDGLVTPRIGRRLASMGYMCRYEPHARAWHLRQDTSRTVLRTWWGWLRPPAERAGSFASGEGLVSRRADVLGRFRRAMVVDMEAGQADLAYISLLGAVAFVAADFAYGAVRARAAGDPDAAVQWSRAARAWSDAVRRACEDCRPMGPSVRSNLHRDMLAIDWWTGTGGAGDFGTDVHQDDHVVAVARASTDLGVWLDSLPRAWWTHLEAGRVMVAADEGWETGSHGLEVPLSGPVVQEWWPETWKRVRQILPSFVPDLIAIVASGREGRGAGEALFVAVTREEHPYEARRDWSERLDRSVGVRCRLDVIPSDALGWLPANTRTVSLHHDAVCVWGDASVVRVIPAWSPASIPEFEAFGLLAGAERALDMGDAEKGRRLAVEALLVARRAFDPGGPASSEDLTRLWPTFGMALDEAPPTVVVARARALLHDWRFTWEGVGPGSAAVARWLELRALADQARGVRGSWLGRTGDIRAGAEGDDHGDEPGTAAGWV